MKAKNKAISIFEDCNMGLETYDDMMLFYDELTIINNALHEVFPRDEIINTKEDLARLCLIKSKTTNLPTYGIDNSNTTGRIYSLIKIIYFSEC